jgi:hypothetical protein
MHKYSGVILDFYDDKGATLKAKFPTVAELPDTIKTASIQPRDELPNEAFALVAVDGADVLRKYACHDAGTTAMSVIYFMEHGDKLPEEAVKVAASNLVEACLAHRMLPPAALTKTAKFYVEKQAGVVDITGLSPRARVKRASAHHMYRDKFPIDSWDQIKKAESYLLENDCRMDPSVRRECAVKLASRAVDVGYPIHCDILEHGAYDFAPAGEMVAAIEMRKVAGADVGILYGLMEKRASVGPGVYAECVRRFDIENDLDGAWDSRIPDPYRSTFGLPKTASVVWEDGADRVDEGQLENLATNGKQVLLGNFSQAFVAEFCQDPVGIFDSMPEPEKRLLSRLASDISSDGRSEGQPKTAAFDVGDIEDRLGVYLPDDREEKARKMIEYRKQRSFTLRHPWLTGIPTLGIAPAVARHRATSNIANQMMREDPGLRQDVSKVRLEKRQRELEDYRLATERARAEQAERVAGQLGTALIGAMAVRNEDRSDERRHQRLSTTR